MPTREEIVAALDLAPHPEGGWYRETWREQGSVGERALGTAIYFLIDQRQSRWHRVDAAEMWHFYTGDRLELEIIENAARRVALLGTALGEGERPQVLVPKGAWQRARSLGSYTLVGCTVVPAFEFSGFEVLADGVDPMP